ncbi:hypothetical protein BC936DRAFT_147217 [Jimgerdemannia flammicorona]|uniref:Uncharacterized protein n=1 Tax=Jimgerdemannia flammicorona TaxID=994334 RepID=A0A433D5V9_9FUNG|nr:hypothetical protein BC936DRAFT_147217 [Jimgerdemannia flammicorona]
MTVISSSPGIKVAITDSEFKLVSKLIDIGAVDSSFEQIRPSDCGGKHMANSIHGYQNGH